MNLLKKVNQMICNIIIVHEGGEAVSSLLRTKTKRENNVEVGMYSYGSCFRKDFCLGGSVTIGRYSSFGSNAHYYGANHPTNYFSTSPYFYRQQWADKWGGVKVDDVERYELVIGNDCWIGSNVVITCGCHFIGNGAVVGAGSIVTHDVEPYTIVAGNPAKVIRKRFSEVEIEALEKSKWFDLTPDNLLEFYKFKDDPIKFSEMIIQSNSKGDLCKKRI